MTVWQAERGPRRLAAKTVTRLKAALGIKRIRQSYGKRPAPKAKLRREPDAVLRSLVILTGQVRELKREMVKMRRLVQVQAHTTNGAATWPEIPATQMA